MGGLLKLSLLCLLAAGANFSLNFLAAGILRLPLFLDTIFTAAITFSAGPLPGIAAAVLSTALIEVRFEDPNLYLFVLCSITEVFLIWAFCKGAIRPYAAVSTMASFLFLALADCVVISVLGGLIDYIVYMRMSQPRTTFSPEDVFKLGLLRNSVPVLTADILARIPINLVDRFVVIFGGYGVSRLMVRFLRGPTG
jgi:hypothetical protein